MVLGRILGSWSCCSSQSQVLSTSFWRGLRFSLVVYRGLIPDIGRQLLRLHQRTLLILLRLADVYAPHRQDLDALMRTSFVWCAAIGIPRLHSALQVLHTTPCAEALSVGRCVQRLGLLFGSLVLGAFSSLRRRLVHTYNVVTSAQLYILVYPHSSNSNQVEISAIKKERGQCCASSRSAAVCPHLGIVKDTWGPSTQCCARGGASLGPDLAEWCPRGSRGGGTLGLLSFSHYMYMMYMCS